MSKNATDWVASKLDPADKLTIIERLPENLLIIKFRDDKPFSVGVIGVQDVILPEHVQPLLAHVVKPQFVVNVPSKTLWRGDAISLLHDAPAAFGTLGDLRKAAQSGNITSYRKKNWDFFEQAIKQHSNVSAVTRIYDEMFEAYRRRGNSVKIVLLDGYHLSAEDV